MNPKNDIYRQLCEQESSIPLFSQAWWLDAVAPGIWDAAIVEEGNRIVASLPYLIERKRRLMISSMPPLTQTLGPWLAPHEAKYTNQLSRQHKLISGLIIRLPVFDFFLQNFHYSVSNWLPFYWQGFQQTTRYTYVIEELSNLDAVWRETRENIRTDVRKAQKKLSVRIDLGLDRFLDLNEKTFARQAMRPPYSRELVARIDRSCAEHNCRRLFFAEDSQGELHAAIYLVWDERSAYYLMGGADPDLRNSGATSFLMWEAIQFAATVTKCFDFEGSMIEPVERFFRAFGARQVPYLSVSKLSSLPLRMRNDVKDWMRLIKQKIEREKSRLGSREEE
jgi:hypothetical protein